MKGIKIVFIILLSLISIRSFAQENNVFLERAFWKTQPSIGVIKEKIKEGHNATQLSPFGFDAVTGALLAQADNSIVKYLLSIEGNGVNKLTHDGRTYIFWAAYKGNLEIMQYLLDKGAKTDVIDDKGYSLLTFTAVTGQTDPALYDLIITHGANVLIEKSKDGANVLLLLIPYLDDFKMVTYFESKGINLKSKDNYGNGAFNYTAQTGNIELLKKLIDKGLNYKTPNIEGGNAFIFASKGTRRIKNGIDVYKFLERLGINPNVTTKKGVNPLHSIAYSSKDKEVLDFFIQKGVSVNQQDEHGNTPFMNAAAYNNMDIVTYLSKHVDDINVQNAKGQTALTKAISSNTLDVISFLVDQKSNTQIIDKEGNSLANYLVNNFDIDNKEDFFKKAEYLRNLDVKFSTVQAKKNTLLHIGIDKMDRDLIDFLVSQGADVNAINADGLTVLHMAAMKANDDNILKYLIELGANKTIKTEFDETVYDLAKENELLKANGIDLQFLK